MHQAGGVLIIAGEASADLHGAHLVKELRRRQPGLPVFGIGGAEMRQEGFEALVPAESLSIAGLTEVLFALPRILGIMRKIRAAAASRRPAVAVLIDMPDFNLRLAKRLKRLGIPVVYYISPQVWAWRQGRVKQIRRLVTRMLVILPFEEGFYRRHGVPVQFVGHPLVEELPERPDRQAARNALALAPGPGPVIALLPGSRAKEVSRHLPVMLAAWRRFHARYPSARALIPVANTISTEAVESAVDNARDAIRIVAGRSTEVLSAADAAIVCSGTSTLQAALLSRPMVVIYRVSWLTYVILKRLVKVAHIALVNLIAGKALVSELVQRELTAENLERELVRLVEDRGLRQTMETEFAAMRQSLGQGGTSTRVVDVIVTFLPSGSAAPAPAAARERGATP